MKSRRVLLSLLTQLFNFIEENNNLTAIAAIKQEKNVNTIDILIILISEINLLFLQDKKVLLEEIDEYNIYSKKENQAKQKSEVYSGFFNSSTNKRITLNQSSLLRFDVDLNEKHLRTYGIADKHRQYIVNASTVVERIVPIKISKFYLKKDLTLVIDARDYFDTNCTNKLLHYFQPNSKILYSYPLETCV